MVIYVINSLLLAEFQFGIFLFFSILLFSFSFFIIRYSVEKFIYEKIRIIYKTIHNLKVSKQNFRDRQRGSSDLLESVNQEVLDWVENKSQEIEDLKKLEVYRREYIGNVSHELKTPIFNIQGYILTLLDGGLEDTSINKEYLLRTEKSINRMIAIIQDLEEISKLESGELKLEFSKFDLIALVKEVIEFLEIKAKKRKVKLVLSPTNEKQIIVRADKKRIRQVLSNLIENSVKYSVDDKAITKISFFDMDEHILVEVTDNGIGVSETDIPRLFERFYRTDKGRSRGEGGTGLGLSIVKHIIEAHEQTINVRSGVGVGTTFGFTLQKGS
ncbi:MAG: sensor histidine kinase [Bacteroidetes bacterium]|nr:sensor histidine kinase [Bacteroidota bacterium]